MLRAMRGQYVLDEVRRPGYRAAARRHLNALAATFGHSDRPLAHGGRHHG